VIDAAKVGLSGERLANVSPVLKKHVGDGKLAGAQTLVWRRGEVVHSECAGVLTRASLAASPMNTSRVGSAPSSAPRH